MLWPLPAFAIIFLASANMRWRSVTPPPSLASDRGSTSRS